MRTKSILVPSGRSIVSSLAYLSAAAASTFFGPGSTLFFRRSSLGSAAGGTPLTDSLADEVDYILGIESTKP